MVLSRRLAVVLTYIVGTCLAGITIETTDPTEAKLVGAAVQILKLCYGNRMISVGLAGAASDRISKILWSQGYSPVTLIDAVATVMETGQVQPQSRYRLEVFVISASSSLTLAKTFRAIRASIWWNHMAAFLIIDWSLSNRDCSNAFEMLWTAWETDVLGANFICHHRTKGRLIYTFNPYTNRAPVLWQLEATYKGKNDHPWALFVRYYEEGVCNDLDFDKTIDLGGYEIRVSVTDTQFSYEGTQSLNYCPGVYDDIFCTILFPALNATPKLLVHSSVNEIGWVGEDGHATGILGEVTSGFTDITSFPRMISTVRNLTTAYPHEQFEIRSLTQYPGYKSQLSKLGTVLDSISRICLLLVLLVTILYFKIFARQSITTAHLNTFRIICNSCLPKIPDKVATRIYLGSVFLCVLTVNGIYQGKLASLLTKDEPLRNVNTMRDLAELGHNLYGYPTYRTFFNDPEFKGRFVDIKTVTCAEYVLRNPKAACIAETYLIISDALKFALHVSHDSLAAVHAVLPIRPDWPLEQRVNTILMRSLESDRIKYLHDNITFDTFRLLKHEETKYKDPRPKVLTLKQLTFAFAMLGIGLGFAAISFVIELSRRGSLSIENS